MWDASRDSAGKGAGDAHVQYDAWGLFGGTDTLSWRQRALCSQTDPEVFFPEKGGSTRDAKQGCELCEVREQCLEWAIDHDERFGIWGGMSERERRQVKKERRCA